MKRLFQFLLCICCLAVSNVFAQESHYYTETLSFCQQELPKNWRDTTFEIGTTSGDFTFYRKDVNSNDSIVTLELTVLPSYNERELKTVCQNELPFDWNGLTIGSNATSGSYTYNGRTVNGCDSIVTLDLTVLSSLHEEQYQAICASELPYTWQDTIFKIGTQSGTYRFTYTSQYGCDSIVDLKLTVYPSYQHHVPLELCQNELPYNWYDYIIDSKHTTGSYTINKTSIHGCDSVVILDLVIRPSYNERKRLTICESELPYTWEDTIFHFGSKSGSYEFKYQSIYGCDSIVTLDLTVLPRLVYDVSVTICEDELPYTWRDTTFAVGTTSNTFRFERKSATGCDSITNLFLTVGKTYHRTESLALCPDQLPFDWFGNILGTDCRTGTYTFEKKTIYGCDSIVTLDLTIYPQYNERERMTVCQNDLPFTWNDIKFDESTTSGSYTFSGRTVHGCDSIVTLDLTVLPALEENVALTICESELPYTWRDTTFAAGTTSKQFRFARRAVNGCDSIINLSLTVGKEYHRTESFAICESELPYDWNGNILDTQYKTGTYTFEKQTIHGCDSTITLELTVYPQYYQRERVTICANELPYIWNDTLFMIGTKSGSYTFNRSSIHGCDSIVTLDLTVLPKLHEDVYLTICESELPYQWRDTTFAVGTTNNLFRFARQAVNGCDSTTHLYLTVGKEYSRSETLVLCQNELPYNWKGNILDDQYKTGTYIFNKETIHGCDSIVTLDLTVHPSYSQRERFAICASELPLTWRDTTFAKGTTSGSYTFRRYTINGCDSIVTLDLTVLPTLDTDVYLTICESELPYTWRDTTFAVGTMSKKFRFERQTSNGCDSITNLYLTVGKEYSSRTALTLCQNELPFDWGGNILDEYTQSGTYTFYKKTIHGCDSILTLDLVVHPSYNQTEYVSICQSELPYIWRDTIFDVDAQSGKYIFHNTSVWGCDSLVTLNLKVFPKYDYSTTLDICTNDLPYTWRDTTFEKGTGSGNFIFHRTSMSGCDSIVHLALTVGDVYEYYESLTLCYSELPYDWNGHIIDKHMENGVYTFTQNTACGCDSVIYLDLFIRPSEDIIDTVTICRSELPYTWRDTTFEAGTMSGVYKFTRTDIFSCDHHDVLTLFVNDTNIVHIYDSVYVDSTYNKYNFNYVVPQALNYVELRQNLSNVTLCDSTVILHLDILPPPFIASVDSMPQICADQNSFDISLTYNEFRYNPSMIEVVFDTATIGAGFVNYASSEETDYIPIAIPLNVVPDIYRGTIYLMTDKFIQDIDIEFMIRYPSSIIEQHWNDVLALRNETQNGGYYLEEYQWYKNNMPLHEETKSYLYVGPNRNLDMGAEYTVEIRRAGETTKVFTCPFIPVPHTDSQSYPTLVGRSVPLRLPINSSTKVEIYTVDGRCVSQQMLSLENNIITTPSISGTYIVRMIPTNNDIVVYKMIVK